MTGSDPIPPGLRARIASMQGFDPLCLPVGQLRDLLAGYDRIRAQLVADPLADVVWHLELFVPGEAAPQGSKTAFARWAGKGDARKFAGVGMKESSEKRVDAWRNDVRVACIPRWDGRPPLDGPLVLEVEFVRKRPAAAPKSYTPDAATMPDLSKYVRSTEDAITSAGVWTDDARVVHTVSSKRCAEIGETPGAHIRVGRRPTARERWLAEKAAPSAPARSLPQRAVAL